MVEIARHETEHSTWEVAARPAVPALAPYLGRALEGWAQTRGTGASLREVPFPGIPLILNLGSAWTIDGAPHDSFVAGMSDGPAFVEGDSSSACIELRLTPLGAHRLLGLPMHEVANRTVALEDVLPDAADLTARLRAASTWEARFDLVERYVGRRIEASRPASAGVTWAWRRLLGTGGREPVGALAEELGWSRRRLIARFREEIGLPPKTAARLLRFERARELAEAAERPDWARVAVEAGYYDQSHLINEFRDVTGRTPATFLQDGATQAA